MPVTAKLSKHFYDVLGEDIANELVEWFNSVDATYRSDLRELNELNFGRFDAKVEQRVAELRAEMQEGFARADAKLEQRVSQLDAKLDQRIAEVRAEMKEAFARADAKLEIAVASLTSAIEKSAERTKADLLKWMFGAWATLLATMIALVKLH
jgi:hypothetical protein